GGLSPVLVRVVARADPRGARPTATLPRRITSATPLAGETFGPLSPSVMDPAYVAVHMEEDRSHWWFRGRLAVILATLRRALPPRRVRLLELGCGTGNVLAALSQFGEAVGMEAHGDLIAAARAAGLDVRAGHLPADP